MMKKIVFLTAILLLVFAHHGFCTTYTGSINYSESGGLYASDVPNSPNDWAYPSSMLSWAIDNTSNAGYWTYSYTFSVGVKNISHIIMEVSPTFALTNINAALTTPGYILDTFSAYSQGNSNTGMPSPMYGLKWGGNGSTLLTWTLVTNRAPMWGDFYAVDGKNAPIYAYNTGYGIDTSALIGNGNAFADGKAWVLVPDTIVPVPPAAWLLGSGLLGLVAIRRRFKR